MKKGFLVSLAVAAITTLVFGETQGQQMDKIIAETHGYHLRVQKHPIDECNLLSQYVEVCKKAWMDKDKI